ncbi:MAG: helix-turn-helix domain-containing protein [Patescibacteria group bacterium]|nr:helix-turn-helix domain-containing protein [Patescibacteria group bacterium]
MYENILTQTGLSAKEALIYELLLQKGEQKATQIAAESGLKRSLAYKVLADLEAKGLVQKNEPEGKVAGFIASHPNKLRDFVEEREQAALSAKNAIDGVLPNLLSSFNLAAGRPGVRFFEGEDGIKKVWWDTLAQTGEVLTMGDVEFTIHEFSKLNDLYLKERKAKKIIKRIISNDSAFNRNMTTDYDSELTKFKFLTAAPISFSSTLLQIYAGKISFTTLSSKSLIGVIIEDKIIYEMFRSLFEYLWATTKFPNELKPKSMYDMSATT